MRSRFRPTSSFESLDLFAGAGGLAVGAAQAGFHHAAIHEIDPTACETLVRNRRRAKLCASNEDIQNSDVKSLDFSVWQGKLDCIFGGPPCQPFSLAGRQQGHRDKRDLFPEFIRALHESRPRSFVVENVKGITGPSFQYYLQYILMAMRAPYLGQKEGERWASHAKRLRSHLARSPDCEEGYRVYAQVLNAADFGVPQKRERLFIVGIAQHETREFHFPEPTHSEAHLIVDQYISSRYWEEHSLSLRHRRELRPVSFRSLALMERRAQEAPQRKRWRTVRDCTDELGPPIRSSDEGLAFMRHHEYLSGARTYAGHTGSALDQPSKTIKAGIHGVPGGENMVRLGPGKVRYYTLRECARIQGFPNYYRFSGSRAQITRQIGNAVPVDLARAVAIQIRLCLGSASHTSKLKRIL